MTAALVRPATPPDHDAIAVLEQSLLGAEAWSRATLDGELTGAGRVVVVAEEPPPAGTPAEGTGTVVGWALAHVVGEVADVQRVAVRPDRQGSGLGRRLVEAVVEAAVTAGAERVLLEVAVGNAPALAAYRRVGFRQIARRRRYYRDGSDALVLQWGRVPQVSR